MTQFVIETPPVVPLPVASEDTFEPVRHICCIGRNDAGGSIEMGCKWNIEDTCFFRKKPNNLEVSGTYLYPSQTPGAHREVEVFMALKTGGRIIPVDKALGHVFGYGLAPT
jgi:fumarylpyruvate hydrolase